MPVRTTGAELRSIFRDISGQIKLLATDDDQTLVTGKASHTIYIQKIIVTVTTDAAQALTFQDSASTPKVIAYIAASPGLVVKSFDFGDYGTALGEGKNFIANVAAAGLAANILWEGYLKPTSTRAA